MIEIHVYYGYPTWISILDMYGCGYDGYPKGYPKYISKYDFHVYYGYPTWMSCLDIHNIHDIQRMELYVRVDEDLLSYPEVHYFHHKLNECKQSLMVALNELDTSQRCVKELESSIQGSLPCVAWAREYYYEMAEELNRDQIRFEVLYLHTGGELEKVLSELWAVQAELRNLKKKAASG